MSFYRRPHCRAIQVVQGRAIKPIVDGTPLPSDFFEARCVGSDGAVHVGLYSGVAAADLASRCRKHSDDDDDDQPPDVLIFGLVILRLYFN